jgi:hypothetical protein
MFSVKLKRTGDVIPQYINHMAGNTMIKYIISSVFSLFLILTIQPDQANAQFEGEIVFRAYEPESTMQTNRYLQFIATPNRIYLNSESQYKVFAGLDADGFLVRNDQNDFVFLSGESDALRISKDDVNSLTNLMQRMTGSSGNSNQFDWEGRFRETGETETISGHRAEKFEVYEEDTNNYISVWLTDEVKVNWGILEETWHQSMSKIVDMDLPIEMIMNRNSFPLKIEYYRDNRLETVVEAVRVQRRSIDQALVEIPDGVKMLGIADLMMRMMRDRR